MSTPEKTEKKTGEQVPPIKNTDELPEDKLKDVAGGLNAVATPDGDGKAVACCALDQTLPVAGDGKAVACC